MTTPWISTHSVEPGTNPSLLVVCDHASNAVPTELNRLGLSDEHLSRHIAWDIGALGVAKAVAKRFAAELIHCGTSRIAIDANRAPESPDLILDRSDGVHVPGNLALSQKERQRRLNTYFRPYHQQIRQALDQRIARGERPLLLAIHSFEPVMTGISRPWPIGVLWKLERKPYEALFAALQSKGINVGDNQPYDGRFAMGYTLEHHAIGRGLPHAMIELRNDEIANPEGQARWARIVGDALEASEMAADRSAPG